MVIWLKGAKKLLYLVRDVLDVLRAFQGGIYNVVCFLCEITPQMLEMPA
jgi:hypothetical protein